MVCCKVVSEYTPAGTEENPQKSWSGYRVTRQIFESDYLPNKKLWFWPLYLCTVLISIRQLKSEETGLFAYTFHAARFPFIRLLTSDVTNIVSRKHLSGSLGSIFVFAICVSSMLMCTYNPNNLFSIICCDEVLQNDSWVLETSCEIVILLRSQRETWEQYQTVSISLTFIFRMVNDVVSVHIHIICASAHDR
jgi:hypothetical protein